MNSEAKINSLISRFSEIRDKANHLLSIDTSIKVEIQGQIDAQTTALLESYDTGRIKFGMFSPDITLPYLHYGEYDEAVGMLQKLSVECAAALGFLDTLSSPIPTADKDRLESLRQEIASLEGFNENLFTHVSVAIGEYEKAHYLASTMLAGKSIIYTWEQFLGQTNEEKVSNLIQSKLLKENLKGQFLRAEKKARNYFTHDISAIPQPQEALALVADACNLSMILMRLKSSGTRS